MNIIRAHAAFGIAHEGWVLDKDIFGYVNFCQYFHADMYSTIINVSFEFFGLEDGLHGFHIHEYPYIPGNSCKDCGGHFNGGRPLWSVTNESGIIHGEHIGDLCFNIRSQEGHAMGVFTDTRISLMPGHPNNIVGRSIMIHQNEDDEGYGGDEQSLINGNSGDCIACANIYYITSENF